MKRIFSVIITALALIAFGGCASYAPNVNLPASMSSIAVPVFVNKTPVYNIEQYVTQKTIDKFLADGRVSVIDEKKADGIVKCRLSKYVLTSTRVDVNQVPQEYLLRIYVNIYLFDNKAQRLLWKDENIWEETTYFVANNLGMPVEDETIARNRILDKMAERIVRRVIYGWNN
jgi:hypothetical protein